MKSIFRTMLLIGVVFLHSCSDSNVRTYLGGDVGVLIDARTIKSVFVDSGECPNRGENVQWLFGDAGFQKNCIELTGKKSIDVYFFLQNQRIDETWNISKNGVLRKAYSLYRPNGWKVVEPRKDISCKTQLDDFLSAKGISRTSAYWIKKDTALFNISFRDGMKSYHVKENSSLLQSMDLTDDVFLFEPKDFGYEFRNNVSCPQSEFIQTVILQLEVT